MPIAAASQPPTLSLITRRRAVEQTSTGCRPTTNSLFRRRATPQRQPPNAAHDSSRARLQAGKHAHPPFFAGPSGGQRGARMAATIESDDDLSCARVRGSSDSGPASSRGLAVNFDRFSFTKGGDGISTRGGSAFAYGSDGLVTAQGAWRPGHAVVAGASPSPYSRHKKPLACVEKPDDYGHFSRLIGSGSAPSPQRREDTRSPAKLSKGNIALVPRRSSSIYP
jgi:hypothetical protein